MALIEKGVADGSIITKGNGIYRVYCLAEATVPLRSRRRGAASGEDEDDEEEAELDEDDPDEDVEPSEDGDEDDSGDGDDPDEDAGDEEAAAASSPKRGRPRSPARHEDPDEDDGDDKEVEEAPPQEATRKRGRPRSTPRVADVEPAKDVAPARGPEVHARKRGRPRSAPRADDENASPPLVAPEGRPRSALQHLPERPTPAARVQTESDLPTISACITDALQAANAPLSTGELVTLVVKRRPTTRGSLKATIHWMRERNLIERNRDGGYQILGKTWPVGNPVAKSTDVPAMPPVIQRPAPAPAAAILAEMYRVGGPIGRRTLINTIVDTLGIEEPPLHRDLAGLERSGIIVRVSGNTFALAAPPKAIAQKQPIVCAAERVAEAERELAAARAELRALLDGKEPT